MKSLIIINATIITPTHVIENASLQVEDGVIVHIDDENAQPVNCFVIDADSAILMPGIIDIHTDALDAEIMPRPGADMPVQVAFRELERKMGGCGFTTVYHSLHLGYEVAQTFSRSKYSRLDIFESVFHAAQQHTLLNNKIHLRFELSGIAAYQQCFDLMDKGYIDLLSVMDHTPGQGQFNREIFLEQTVKQGKTPAQALAEYEEYTSKPKIEGEELKALIGHAIKLGIPVASHDDDTADKVDQMHSLGIKICEFPINMQTATHATALGMHVIGGASNVLRGGSLSGNLNIRDAVIDGVIDTLCSDYYPPAILHAVFKLHQEEGLPLPQAINLATLNAAKSAGIDAQTGSIETGKDADLLIVKMIDGIPMVTHTIVKGKVVSQASFKVKNHKIQAAV